MLPEIENLGHVHSIEFVCTGNICRSPMAECFFNATINNKNIVSHSSGTHALSGMGADLHATLVMAELGLNLHYHKSNETNIAQLNTVDLIVVMETYHKIKILKESPEIWPKLFLLNDFNEDPALWGADIFDPMGMPQEIFEKCFEVMKISLMNLIKICETRQIFKY